MRASASSIHTIGGTGGRITRRLRYYHRILTAYLGRRASHLSFWHEKPELTPQFQSSDIGAYYMRFTSKADYAGPFDNSGVPLLDYHGLVGLQYNPIAVAQYGLGNYNLFHETKDPARRLNFLRVADWLVTNLEENPQGLWVWNHHFDWEYRTPLKAPWYSALAQGQGISLLLRAYQDTQDATYLEASEKAFHTFVTTIEKGGVTHVDPRGYTWFEETIVDPPTHILNGFIWALWGIYDYWIFARNPKAAHLFDEGVRTLKHNLQEFDVGFWSLYEQSNTVMKMLASPFYHRLHIVQLQVMHQLTKEPVFGEFASRWQTYYSNDAKRTLAVAYKALFKLLYY